MFKALSKIGLYLKRTTVGSDARSDPGQHALAIGIFVSIALIGAFTFSNSFEQLVNDVTNVRPNIEIPRARWKVYFPKGFTPRCQAVGCTEPIPQKEIDSSDLRLSDSDIFTKTGLAENRNFWVGATISKEELHLAIRQQAFIYVIGHINASHRFYVNGRLTAVGDGKDYMYVFVDLFKAFSDQPDILQVSAFVSQDLSSARPFVVGAPIAGGLVTRGRAKQYRDQFVVWSVVHQLVAGVIALTATLTFLVLWMSNRERVELLLFSAFAFCLAINQFGAIGYFKHEMYRLLSYRFDSFTRICSASLGAMIGVSFSRTRESINWLIALIGIALAIVVASSNSGAEALQIDSFIGTYFVPSCFLFSSFVSACQAAALKETADSDRAQERWRLRQLWMFSVLNFLISGFSLFSSRAILSIDIFSTYHLSSQLLIVFLLGLFLIVNHRKQLAFLKVASIKAEIAAQVAHDIRAPIAVIDAKQNSTGSSNIDPHIKTALDRIRSISKDLLEINQTQERAQTIQLVSVESISETVLRIAQEKKVVHPSLDIEVQSIECRSDVRIRAAPENLARCLSNILDNSIETPAASLKRIQIAITEDSNSISVTISDNGSGIARNVLKRVGTRGFSFGKGRNGSGFGLHFVRECTKQWGAKFQIQSTENKGTSVSIRFEKVAPHYEAATKFVLLDDDNETIKMWSLAARRNGIQLLCFESFDRLSSCLEHMHKSTGFYIDVQLGSDSPNGLEVARLLHEKGYKNLYLATGSPAANFAGIKWIKAVVGKEPPWSG